MKIASVDRKVIYAIFDSSQIHTSSSRRSSLVLLPDPEIMGRACFYIQSRWAKTHPLCQIAHPLPAILPKWSNHFGSDNRLSMSLQSVNDLLLAALNGVGTGNFDPRPAVAYFLGSKRRRYREPKIQSYSTQPFMKKFFRTESEILM